MKITSILAASVVAVLHVDAVQRESVPNVPKPNHVSGEDQRRDLHHIETLDIPNAVRGSFDSLVFVPR